MCSHQPLVGRGTAKQGSGRLAGPHTASHVSGRLGSGGGAWPRRAYQPSTKRPSDPAAMAPRSSPMSACPGRSWQDTSRATAAMAELRYSGGPYMYDREGGRKGGRKEEGEGGERKRSNGDGQGIDPLRSRPSADQPIRTPFRALVRTANRPRSSAFRRGRPGRSERAAPATHTHTHTHAHTRQGRA